MDILIGNNLVSKDVDVTLDLGILHSNESSVTAGPSASNTGIGTHVQGLDVVQMRSLEDEEPQFPSIEALSTLAHPSLVVG